MIERQEPALARRDVLALLGRRTSGRSGHVSLWDRKGTGRPWAYVPMDDPWTIGWW